MHVATDAESRLEGDLRPFTGSGTTLVAAQQLGRVALGMELDPGYVATTLERLAAFELKPELVKET